MKLFLISHGDYDYDGRLRELFKMFSGFGGLFAVTRGSNAQNPRHRIYPRSGYLGFIRAVVAYGKECGPADLLVLDNRKSVIPGLLLRGPLRPKIIVLDCRELYVSKDVKHFVGKVGSFFERIGIKRADILICANEERAGFMQELYHLRNRPLVYENLRRLEYSDGVAPGVQAEKFTRYLKEGEFRIISTAGCSVSRTTDILVSSLKWLAFPFRLFLVGESTEADRSAIRCIIKEEGLEERVEILGRLNQDELKYLISVCHIGVVNYSQADLNNKFCASGKLYEFVYEGLPVITTTNPPLKRLCDTYRIGIADDGYSSGIQELAEHYEEYRKNVRAFARMHTVEENNANLVRQLRERLPALF